MKIDFGAKKTPVKIINVNNKCYKKWWKEFDELNNIDQNYYCSSYYVSVNKYKVKCGTSLRF